ncbi:MAG: hypothetical protein R3C05_32070, partial [Pirellulaceae bacterium]
RNQREMESEKNATTTVELSRKRRLFRTFRLGRTLYCLGFLFAVLFAGLSIRNRRMMEAEVSRLTQRHRSLDAIQAALLRPLDERKTAEAIIVSALKDWTVEQHRTPLESDYVIAVQQAFNTVLVVVPRGNHVLRLDFSWRTDQPVASRVPTRSTKETQRSQVWDIPVIGPGGYWLELDDRPGGDVLSWKLVGNSATFDQHRDDVPLKPVISTLSVNYLRRPFVPGQIQARNLTPTKTISVWETSPRLFSMNLVGHAEKQRCAIELSVRLWSDCRRWLSVDETALLSIAQRKQYLDAYESDGRFYVQQSVINACLSKQTIRDSATLK